MCVALKKPWRELYLFCRKTATQVVGAQKYRLVAMTARYVHKEHADTVHKA
jgi:hypothetical protein